MAQDKLDNETRASIYITEHLYVFTDDPAHILIDMNGKQSEARFTKDVELNKVLKPDEVTQVAKYRKALSEYEKGEGDPLDTNEAILEIFPSLSVLGGVPLVSADSLKKRQVAGQSGNEDNNRGSKTTSLARRKEPSDDIIEIKELVKNHWTEQQIATVKDMTARSVTVAEFKVFMYQAYSYALDPLLREIFIVKYGDNDPASIIVAHAGMLKKVALSGEYDGMKTVTYWHKGMTLPDVTGDTPDHTLPHFTDKGEIDDIPLYVDAWAYRKNIANPAYFRAYYPTFVRRRKDGKPNQFWASQPENMLRKCAEAGALRKQFPEVLGSLYIPEEMPEHKGPTPVENEAS